MLQTVAPVSLGRLKPQPSSPQFSLPCSTRDGDRGPGPLGIGIDPFRYPLFHVPDLPAVSRQTRRACLLPQFGGDHRVSDKCAAGINNPDSGRSAHPDSCNRRQLRFQHRCNQQRTNTTNLRRLDRRNPAQRFTLWTDNRSR